MKPRCDVVHDQYPEPCSPRSGLVQRVASANADRGSGSYLGVTGPAWLRCAFAFTMRSVTRKHMSVVNGCARFAQVTVAETAIGSDAPPALVLNGYDIAKRREADEALIASAVRGLAETEARLGWRGLPLRVTKVESSYVDMHPDAAHKAAISAATSLIEGEI